MSTACDWRTYFFESITEGDTLQKIKIYHGGRELETAFDSVPFDSNVGTKLLSDTENNRNLIFLILNYHIT